MAGIHQVAHRQPVGSAYAFGGIKRALNFADDVPRAAINRLVHLAFRAFQRGGIRVAQRRHAEDLRCGFTLGAALGVCAIDQLVFDVGIDDEQGDRWIIHRYEFGLARAAVEQQQMIFPAHYRNELVHDATRHAGEFVFGLLAKQRLFDGIKLLAGGGFQQGSRTHLQRGAAGQTTSEWDGRMQQHIESGGLDAVRHKTGDDTAGVIRPFQRAGSNGRGYINHRRFGTRGVTDLNDIFAVGGVVASHDGVTFDGHRQHKAIVVIGVFADDIDPARGGHNPARQAAIGFGKFL